MQKLIVIANLGRVRPVKFKPAGEDPQDKAHLCEVPGSTVELRPQSITQVVTDRVGRFRQSGSHEQQGGMSYGEEHHLQAELAHQALERIAGTIGDIVASAGYPAWRLVFPQELLPSLRKALPAAAALALSEVVTGDLTQLPLAELEKRFLNGH
ncbi:MAG: host attachment protein [Verrucomicrobiota bacterium]